MTSEKQYCVIIGDIRKSRELGNRGQVQEDFQRALDAINAEFAEHITAKFIITIGDEFQGVLTSLEKSYDVCVRVEDLLHPVRFAFGIGFGEITTALNDIALGMDGPAFHRARQALETAKRDGRWIIYDTALETFDTLANALLALLHNVRESWTDRQREIVFLLSQLGTHQKVAEKLGVARSAVTQSLTAANWGAFAEAQESLRRSLSLLKPSP